MELFRRPATKVDTDIANLAAIVQELNQLAASCAATAQNLNKVVVSAKAPIKGNAGYFVTENAVTKYSAQLQALRLQLKTTASHLPAADGYLARAFEPRQKAA
ncbi:hypothetical protein A2642_02170 [Candidatus Nomurabacteria bacterium RIFCSPHIGHO2_01_FULL_39_10]|uniref:Uncharacterized protein n=1 Tax=Candidatus Nomurabacteria bacterium RIFCSPHIGHO2_01_FULL_39_10 TaxID=1801733 RepID=A0A1F6V5F0_9BACT|nr:MAG: hypothetical protein A2642_02170 [Candidatus Nomurabacteria bacterium RIFCSPHIGHO2_01_FULL_39_10]